METGIQTGTEGLKTTEDKPIDKYQGRRAWERQGTSDRNEEQDKDIVR